jgi:hypothetical protein
MTDPNKAFDVEHEPFWFAKANVPANSCSYE